MSSANQILAKFKALGDEKEKHQKKLDILKDELKLTVETNMFLTGFLEFYRDKVKSKIESLANSALSCVFQDKVMDFKVLPHKTKRGLDYQLYIYTNGVLTSLKDAKGGGVLDIISIALRISFLKMFPYLRQTMILDEPFKNIDSVRIVPAVQWLKEVSKKLEIQFIIVTHETDLIDISDNSYTFKLVAGETKVVRNQLKSIP